jgi:methyl-accepting chemotaxis protein
MPDQQAITGQPAGSKRPSRFFGQYIIKNGFQFKFSFVVFVFLAVASFVIWFEGQWAVNKLVTAGLVTDEQSMEHFRNMNRLVAQTGLLIIAISFLLSLYFSHYVAGPIYRFEKTFEAMREGDLSMFVRLRKRDEFKDTAEVFNQALTSLRHRVQKERDGIAASTAKLKGLSERLKQEGRPTEAAELDKLIFDLNNNPPHVKI